MSDPQPVGEPVETPPVLQLSIKDRLAILKHDDPDAYDAYIAALDDDELDLLVNDDWSVVARPQQLIPDDVEFGWFCRAGRGGGKTRTGSETTVDEIKKLLPHPAFAGDARVRWALMSQRSTDVRSTMIEGDSGLRRVIPPSWFRPGDGWDDAFNRSSLEIELRDVYMQGFSARTPDAPRGPQFNGGWVDEPASFPDAHLGLDEDTAMSNLLFGMRLEPFGVLIITGTPKNNRLIRDLRKLPGVVETVWSTRDNLSNLSPTFEKIIVDRYEGTRLGRQELDAEILEGLGAIFQIGWFRLEPRGFYPWPDGSATAAVRYWDLASGEETDTNPDPDWTAGALVRVDPQRRLYVIEHIDRFRASPGQREQNMRARTKVDGLHVVWIEKEPGNAGKSQHHWIGRELDDLGVSLMANPVSGPKAVRWQSVASAAEQQRVIVWEDDTWNRDFFDECEEAHPDPKLSGPHDDMLDAVAGAFEVLRTGGPAVSVGTGRPPGEGQGSIPRPRPGGQRPGGIPRPGQRGSAAGRRRGYSG